MKFFKGLFIFLMIVIIVGGLGFLGYSILTGSMPGGMDMSSNSNQDTTDNKNMDMSDMDNASNNMNQNAAIPNPIDAQNREKIIRAIDLIDQAMELITIDPYSNATVPGNNQMQMDNTQGNTTKSNGTINIYPSDNSSVSIIPENNTTDAAAGTTQSMTMNGTSMGNMNMESTSQNVNYVYDQAKLQQLHSGIFTMAQGILAINDLSDNLMNQSMTLEQQPFTYQTYVTRYNNALENQSELEKAISLLDSASILINVNPYASNTGYSYKSDSMERLHEGIYKYAQGMAELESLKKDLINQMSSASTSAQNLVYGSNQMVMSGSGLNLLGNLNLNTIFSAIIIILVIGLVIGVLGAVFNLFKHKPDVQK